jgi:hypothetical protein
VQSNLTATDINGDGYLDYVITQGWSDLSGDYTRIYAFPTETPYQVAYNPETIEWSGYRNNPQHTGLYAQPVTGTQLLPSTKWSGRIIVHGNYIVPANHSLTILPGTVVEFAADASIIVYGGLSAVGMEQDSIYFKPDGTGTWGTVSAWRGSSVTMIRCVIHGGSYVGGTTFEGAVNHCHIYDMHTDSILNVDHSENALR